MASDQAKRTKKETVVVGITFSGQVLKRLDALCQKGSHGTTRTEVVRSFVEDGIRQAMKDRFIPMDD